MGQDHHRAVRSSGVVHPKPDPVDVDESFGRGDHAAQWAQPGRPSEGKEPNGDGNSAAPVRRCGSGSLKDSGQRKWAYRKDGGPSGRH